MSSPHPNDKGRLSQSFQQQVNVTQAEDNRWIIVSVRTADGVKGDMSKVTCTGGWKQYAPVL